MMKNLIEWDKNNLHFNAQNTGKSWKKNSNKKLNANTVLVGEEKIEKKNSFIRVICFGRKWIKRK